MGKLFLFKFLLIGILFGQSTFENNIATQRVSPIIYLNGLGNRVNFYEGDVALVLTSKVLTDEEVALKVATSGNAIKSIYNTSGIQILSNKTLTSPKANEEVALTATIGTTDYFIAANDATNAEKAVANIVCDGMADQVQINAALTAGYNIKLSSGTFNTSATITAAINNVIIAGAGKEKTTIFLSNSSNCHVITIGGNFWTIKNLLINGNHASNTTLGNGIFGKERTDININNCELKNTALNGIAIKNNSNNWVIESCYIHDVGSACIFGYQEDPSTTSPSKIKINNCHFHNSILESQIKTQPDINYMYLAHDWDIDSCLFTGTTGYKGVLFSGSKNCNISNCYFDIEIITYKPGNITDVACQIRFYKGASGTISNNKFVTNAGIEIWGGVGVNIIGNNFTETRAGKSQECIMIVSQGGDGYDTKNVNITGNVMYNTSKTLEPAIVLYAEEGQTVSDVSIVGNTILDDRGASAMCKYGVDVNGVGTVKNVTISNNIMEGILETGIVIIATTTENFIISNNIFKDVPVGINAIDWSNLNINGNRFTDCPYPLNK